MSRTDERVQNMSVVAKAPMNLNVRVGDMVLSTLTIHTDSP